MNSSLFNNLALSRGRVSLCTYAPYHGGEQPLLTAKQKFLTHTHLTIIPGDDPN